VTMFDVRDVAVSVDQYRRPVLASVAFALPPAVRALLGEMPRAFGRLRSDIMDRCNSGDDRSSAAPVTDVEIDDGGTERRSIRVTWQVTYAAMPSHRLDLEKLVPVEYEKAWASFTARWDRIGVSVAAELHRWAVAAHDVGAED